MECLFVNTCSEIRECLKRDADHKECQPHYKKVKKLVSLQESMESAVREQRWPDCLSKANSILDLEKQVFTYRLQALGRLCHCQSEVNFKNCYKITKISVYYHSVWLVIICLLLLLENSHLFIMNISLPDVNFRELFIYREVILEKV